MTALLRAALLAGLVASTAASADPLTPAADIRPPDQTFLTYPEWFLVHSPAEFAEFSKAHAPSEFPFMGHVRQFWSSYATVRREIRKYPFNFGYHVMIVVIGTSTTVEYAVRWAYENLVGRLTALAEGIDTPEDRFAADVAQDYVDFIRVRPWYEYGFMDKLKGLWRSTPLWGPHALRKWERKYALTTEYLVKAAYAELITFGTRSAYDPASPVTGIVVDRMPAQLEALPEFKVISTTADGAVVATVPRYEAFKNYAATLAQQGVAFREIAGNDGDVLVTVLAPAGWQPAQDERVLFEQPILTRPGERRLALVERVPRLGAALSRFAAAGVSLEHVYDF